MCKNAGAVLCCGLCAALDLMLHRLYLYLDGVGGHGPVDEKREHVVSAAFVAAQNNAKQMLTISRIAKRIKHIT